MPQSDNIHSEEVQAIMGHIPHWVVRWGITVIASVWVLIIIGCCVIKYPQTVTAPVIITTLNPPSALVTRYGGLLDSVYVVNNQCVAKGDLIAVFSTPARYADVEKVRCLLQSISFDSVETPACWLGKQYELGTIHTVWAQFEKQYSDFCQYLASDYIGQKMELLSKQVMKSNEYYSNLTDEMKIIERDMSISRVILSRDSTLFAQKIISKAEYEQTEKMYLSAERSYSDFISMLTNTELNILQLEQQIVELQTQRTQELNSMITALEQHRQQILAEIDLWRDTYVITSPTNGVVSLQKYWHKNQYVSVGEQIATITPQKPSEVIGRMNVGTQRFGEVRIGQTVNVKLNAFPYMEYGILKGKIRTMSATPIEVQTQLGTSLCYTVEVDFDNRLTTTYNKHIPLIQQMDGSAEIIVKDMRLIHHFIMPIVSLFKNE